MNEPVAQLTLHKWRRVVVLIGMWAIFVLLLLRAAYIQLAPDPQVDREIASRFEKTNALIALRGKILDRNDERLAASELVIEVSANPQQIKQDDASKEKLRQALALLGVDQQLMLDKLAASTKKHLVIKANVAPQLAKKVGALGVSGLHYTNKLQRQYTCHHDCGQLIGKQGKETNSLTGYVGLERVFNSELKGENGFHKFVKAKGMVIEGIKAMARPKHGQDIVLSIDAKIQHFAYEALVKAVTEKAKAKAGAAVVLNAKTGEIYALATYPSFDPNHNTKPPQGGYVNRAIQHVYEPGSIMKSFTIAAALESGRYSQNTLIDTGDGKLAIGHDTVTDHEPFGILPVWKVLQKSSNVGTSKIAFELGAETLWNTYRKLGFGQKTNIEFYYEHPGQIRDYHRWRPFELATHSFGHGISTTILQIARAYTVFANDGVLLPISLLKQYERPIGAPVFRQKTAQQVLAMMRTVVAEGGTAPEARVEGYSVAGKTGTADRFSSQKHGYDKGHYVSSFVGIAPATNPEIIMAVMIDDPDTSKKSYYGGKVAGPVFSEVVSKTLNYLGVPRDFPDETTMVLHQQSAPQVTINKAAKGT